MAKPESPKWNVAIWILGMAVFHSSFYAPAFSADPIGSLIDSEQSAEKAWLAEDREPPAAILWGDSRSVDIFNPRAVTATGAMCSDISFDEWIDVAGATDGAREITLNTGVPRIRDLLSDTCLLRPTDRLLAVGPGWQVSVALQTFVLRRVAQPCKDLFPYVLAATLDRTTPEPPLFFTTSDFGERENHFSKPAFYPANASAIRMLGKSIQQIDEYVVSTASVSADNVDMLALLERRVVTLDDDALPHQILASCKAGACESVWMERVNHRHGSGRFQIVGVLDFDGDDRLDMVVEGDHEQCPYTKIFSGNETGFTAMETPLLPCGC